MSKRQALNNKLMRIALFAGLMLAGCSQSQKLPFNTIAKESTKLDLITGENWEDQSDFFIITESGQVDAPKLDIPKMQIKFSPVLAEQLHTIDYQRHFVVVVFRWLGALSSKYTVEILQITRDGEKVVLKVHFGKPGPNETTGPAFSSPHHIVAVPKEGKWAQDIRFVLEVDGKEVKEHICFIP